MHFDQVLALYNNQLWSNLVQLAPFAIKAGTTQDFNDSQRQQISVMLGDAFMETKEWRTAESLYKNAIQLKKQTKPGKKTGVPTTPEVPESPLLSETSINVSEVEIKYKLHLCYINTGQHSQAVNVLKSIPAKQRNAKCNMALGKLYQQASMERPAIGCFREVLKTCPMAIEAAQALMVLGVKGVEIQELTLETTSGIPGMDWFVLWTQAYSAYATKNDYTTAITLLKQLEDFSICKNNLCILVTLGQCQYNNGDDINATITLQRVHRLDPNHLRGMDILAALLAKERKIKDLEHLATRLMAVSEEAPEPWIAMGYYCYVSKKGSRSLFFAHKGCMIDRRNVEALILKGNILLDMKKLQDAMNHFREAVVLAPHRYETHKGMVDCYLAQSRHREAVSVATSSCKQLNNSPRALTLYASVLFKDPLQLSSAKAKSLLEKALTTNPYHLPAVYLLAEILEQEMNFEQAVVLLRKQLGQKSTSKLHIMLADLLAKNHEEEQALEHYRIALNLNPKNVAAKEGLQKIEQATDGNYDGGAGPNVSGVASGGGAANYNDMLYMDDVNSEGEEDEEEEEEDGGGPGDDLEESETEAVWSDGDLNLSANNY